MVLDRTSLEIANLIISSDASVLTEGFSKLIKKGFDTELIFSTYVAPQISQRMNFWTENISQPFFKYRKLHFSLFINKLLFRKNSNAFWITNTQKIIIIFLNKLNLKKWQKWYQIWIIPKEFDELIFEFNLKSNFSCASNKKSRVIKWFLYVLCYKG